MFPTNSQELGSRYHIHKSLHQIVEELTTPGKILIQFNGWRNVCQTLDYIFGHCYDIFDELSGISLEFEGLSQVVGYVYSAENLKKKALLGGTIITTTSFYTFCLLQSVVLFLLRRAVIKLLVYKLTN
ncbi:unnamed protein product [Nezara viridula]|uniref:Uncharacterized protein n=1 Tax=Nezara viridula TaxID=85310 RepID=A0A9P0HHR8_NEZVI|nr:unnamed protein product [Nezara viridula]